MCGIFGSINPLEENLIKHLFSRLSHRGPDGTGLWKGHGCLLGHTRLAIVDIDGGAQPMHDKDNAVHIAFNGEIYNHKDIRRQLGEQRFQSESDTESIIELFKEDAGGHINRLDGMFAYALNRNGEMILGRDPLGIKPLYMGKRKETLVFASEIKALADICDTVREFPPGHVFSSVTGFRSWYQIIPEAKRYSDPAEAIGDLSDRIEQAVRKRLMADVPLGVFLSGGLDSSLIAALAAHYKHPLDTFAVGTEGSEDLVRAREVADFLGTRHHEALFSMEQAVAVLPEVIYYLESFDAALVRSAVPNYFLAKLASDHVKVALAGEGADELFSGYAYLKELPPSELGEELFRLTLTLHNTNLQRCDRMSMAHGLEVRVPFLDRAVVEAAFNIPTGWKIHPETGIEKWILRKVAEPLLPDAVVWRPKMKFAEGAGFAQGLGARAETHVSDHEFKKGRTLSNGRVLRSKEEYWYFQIFSDCFPADKVLHLVGQTKSP